MSAHPVSAGEVHAVGEEVVVENDNARAPEVPQESHLGRDVWIRESQLEVHERLGVEHVFHVVKLICQAGVVG